MASIGAGRALYEVVCRAVNQKVYIRRETNQLVQALDEPAFEPPSFSENEAPVERAAEPAPAHEGGHAPEKGRDSIVAFAGLAVLSLLLLAFFIGAVFYLSSHQKEEESCIIDASIHCITWRLSPTGRLDLKLANGHGSRLFLDGVACSSDPLFDAGAPLSGMRAEAESGGAVEISFTCTGPGGSPSTGLTGEPFEGKLFIQYHLEGERAGSRGVVGSLKTART